MLVTLFVGVSKLILMQLFVLLHLQYLLCLAALKPSNSFTDEDFVVTIPFCNNLLELARVASELLSDLV